MAGVTALRAPLGLVAMGAVLGLRGRLGHVRIGSDVSAAAEDAADAWDDVTDEQWG